MKQQSNKQHQGGIGNKKDCFGHYDPSEAECRGCHPTWNRSSDDPCKICFELWHNAKKAKAQQKDDALTDAEKKQWAEFLPELRKLY